MFFALAQCVNFSQILKPYLSENVVSVFSCLFVCNVGQMTITWSRILLCKFSAATVFRTLRIVWRTSGINCWNAVYFTVSSLPRCAVATPFGIELQFTIRSCSGPQAPWNFQSRIESVKNILVTWWNNHLLSFWPPKISANGGSAAVVSGMSSLK